MRFATARMGRWYTLIEIRFIKFTLGYTAVHRHLDLPDRIRDGFVGFVGFVS